MSSRQWMDQAQWRTALLDISGSLPAPDEALDALLDGYDHAAVVHAERVADAMMLPRPSRPRVSPASLHVQKRAFDFGCFFHTASLRAELKSAAIADERWQTSYLQQHPVAAAADKADTNVEIHDLVHAMLGLMWWPGIGTHDFYLASRLSEATAAYHYYFLDQVLEPRCETHENVVDLARIWKFNICPDCNREENRYFNLTPERQARARIVAFESVRAANAFYRTELEEIAKEAVEGVGFVERNRVNLAANAADALRYGHYTHPFLSSPMMGPYLDLLRPWQVSGGYHPYLARALEVIQQVVNVAEPAAAPEVGRRRWVIAQDVVLRIRTVRAQIDTGARDVSGDTVEVLDEYTDLFSAWAEKGGTERELECLFASFTDGVTDPEDVRTAIARVGYEPVLALRAVPAIEHDETLRAAPDVALVARTTASELARALPRTVRYLAEEGVFPDLVERFRRAPARLATVEQAEGDGRAPRSDKLVQRLQLFLRDMSTQDDRRARVAHAISAVEHGYRRYQVRVKPDLDVRAEPVSWPGPATVLQLSPAAQAVASEVDITDPTGGPRTYLYSLTRGRTYLTAVPPAIGDWLTNRRHQHMTIPDVASGLATLGLDEQQAEGLIRQWLRIGVLVLPPGRALDHELSVRAHERDVTGSRS